MHRFPRNRIRLTIRLLLAVLLVCSCLEPVMARTTWRAARRHSAWVRQQEINIAAESVRFAQVVLESAHDNLTEARDRLAMAELSGEGAAHLFIAVGNATAAVAKAKAAWLQAKAVLSVVVATDFGTKLGEGADYLITYVWDPNEPIDALDPTYTTPTAAEIDLLIEAELIPAAGFSPIDPQTMADFLSTEDDVPGVGLAAWNYIHAVTRLDVILLEGGAAFTAGLCDDLLAARDDLALALADHIEANVMIMSLLDAPEPPVEDPTAEMLALSDALDVLEPFVADAADPVELQAAIDQARTGIDEAFTGIDALGLPGGGVRPWLGPDGFLPDLSVPSYLDFLDAVAEFGEPALPPGEVAILDALLAARGLSFQASPGSIGPLLASYVAEGDTADEVADMMTFGGVQTFTEVLGSAIPFRWEAIDLSESPLVIVCETTAVEGPGLAEANLRIFPNRPNPFNPRTLITFTLEHPAEVRVEIFDAAGRRVCRLAADQEFRAGVHQLPWNGTDQAGRIMPSGNYLFRVSAAGEVHTGRMTMVR